MQIVIPPFPLRELSIRGLPKGVAAPLSEQQTNISDRNQIRFQKCSHEPKRRQVIVCGTQRPSIKSPPSPLTPLLSNGKKTRWKNKMLTCPHRTYRLKSFYASSFIFGLLTFRQSRRCRLCAGTSPPRPTSPPAPLIKYSHTHISYIHTYIYTVHS